MVIDLLMKTQAMEIGSARKNYHKSRGGGKDTTLEDEWYGVLAELIVEDLFNRNGIKCKICLYSENDKEYSKEDLTINGKTIDIKAVPMGDNVNNAMVNCGTFKNCDYYVFVKFVDPDNYKIYVATGRQVAGWYITNFKSEAYTRLLDKLPMIKDFLLEFGSKK